MRVHTEPVGVVRFPYGNNDTRDALAEAIVDQLGDVLTQRLGVDSRSLSGRLETGIPAGTRAEEYLGGREAALREGPTFSVVLSTRNRPSSLASCLEALRAQSYSRFEVIVVDNTTGDPAVERLVEKARADISAEYVVERRAGLSRARNRGVAAAAGDVVAFIDDDEIADPHWVAELARGYIGIANVASVNGSIMPAELNTQAQDWFEQYGGHSKGRGFLQEIFDPLAPDAQSPLYPLPPFGAGGNMSFRKAVLTQLGGFDNALGAGTPACGAEETAAFTHVLLLGHRIVYRPSAVVWHKHYEHFDDLQRQLRALGTSLTAYYTSLVWSDPRLVMPLMCLFPRGVQDLTRRDSIRSASLREDFPPALLRAYRRGMLAGPAAYLRGRLAARQADAQA